MGKYTVKIITQGIAKIYGVITTIISSCIYGKPYDGERIISLFQQRGIYSQTGFRGTNTSTTALFSYRNREIKQAVWQLKFKNGRRIANTFGIILCDYLTEELSNEYYLEHFAHPILVVIPVSPQTKRTRGYNQNHLIVQHALACGLSHCVLYEPNLITKPKHTPPQSRTKNKQDRQKNIRNQFHLQHQDHITGRNVILFDDVRTTGATLDEATRLLVHAGARKVMRVTLAH